MILTEYDYDTDIAVQREEAYEEGLSKGINQGISQGIRQGISQGISQGAEQNAIETAKNFLSENLPIEQVARCTGLSIEQVEKLATELSNTATPHAKVYQKRGISVYKPNTNAPFFTQIL